MLHMRAGQMTDALAAFSEAIALLGELPADRARALGNRGDVYLHQGRLPAAVDDFRAAAEAFAHRRARRGAGEGRAQPRLRADAGGRPDRRPRRDERGVPGAGAGEPGAPRGLRPGPGRGADGRGARRRGCRAAPPSGPRLRRPEPEQRQAEAELALARGLVVRRSRRLRAGWRPRRATRFARAGPRRVARPGGGRGRRGGRRPGAEGAGAGQPCSPAGGARCGPRGWAPRRCPRA